MPTRCRAAIPAASSSSSATVPCTLLRSPSANRFMMPWPPARVTRSWTKGRTKRRSIVKYCLLLSATLLAAGCGGKSTSDWVEQMHSSDSAERLHAAKALGERWGDASAVVPALTEALRDKDSFVRQE